MTTIAWKPSLPASKHRSGVRLGGADVVGVLLEQEEEKDVDEGQRGHPHHAGVV